MRRGLISWNREELPPAALDARVARIQTAMKNEGLGAVLAYASFAQPAPVQWLTNFIPYWSEAVLLVLPQGAPRLLVALTPRVHFWIRDISHVGDLVAAPKPGAKAAELLAAQVAANGRIGVVSLDTLPWTVAQPLADAFGARLVDASALYAAARHPADDAEQALARKALAMAEGALASVPKDARTTADVIAAVDHSARMAGAEEVLPRIAPDLGIGQALLRMEEVRPLGARYAIDCSLAYRGVWVRSVRSVARDAGQPASWAGAQAWFDGALQRISDVASAAALAAQAPGRVLGWTLEASTASAPLSVIASDAQPSAATPLPAGSLAVFSVRLELGEGPWVCSAPLRIGQGALAA